MEPFDSYRVRVKNEYERFLKEINEKYENLIESARKSLYSDK